MKKITAVILALLLLTQAFSAFALVKSMDILIDQQNDGAGSVIRYVETAAVLGDKLYLASYEGSFVWDSVTGELTPLTKAAEGDMDISNARDLVSDGETMYDLDIQSGTLTKLEVAGDAITYGEAISFDNESLLVSQDEYAYTVQLYSSALLGSKLYLFTGSSDDSDYSTRVLHAIDLQTGKCETLLSGKNLSAMLGYKEGNLLIKVFDWDKFYENEQSEDYLPTLTVFDTKQKKLAQTLSTLKDVYAGGFVYDEKADIIYMMMDGQLFRQTATGEMESINYIMINSYNDSAKAMLIGSAQYVLVDYSGIFIRSTDINDRPSTVLRVTGANFAYTGSAGYQAFKKAHPEVAVTSQDADIGTAEALYRDFMSDTAGDIYSVYDAGILDALIKKGYCMDLSGSSKLTQAVSKMYPHMTEDFYRDGKLYAIPLEIYLGNVFGFSPSLFEKIGIAREDVPSTLVELMDFMVDWVDIYADKYPDLDLFRHEDQTTRELLRTTIFAQQLAYCQKEGIPFTFDTPQMHLLLSKLDEVAPIISYLDAEDADGSWGMSSDDPLVALIDQHDRLYGGFAGTYTDYEPMFLGLADDIPMLHAASMSMLMVNPNTKHPELAIALLESLVDNMEAAYAFLLFPDRNEPLEKAYYQQEKKNYDDYVKSIEEQLAKETDELVIKQLQEDLENTSEWAIYLEKSRYDISPEEVARYRSVAENVYPTGGMYSVFEKTDSLESLFKRYMEGQIPSEQFIKETEKILKMIYLENK